MAEVRPFKGYRFRLNRPEELGRYASPPYDMIDEGLRSRLYEKDPHNIVRVIQNRPADADTRNRDRHVRAAALLNSWIAGGIIAQDRDDSMYVYRQRFSVGGAGKTFERTGLVARVKLSPFSDGIVIPHENTLSAPKADRLEHLQETRCNTGQIFGLVPDRGDLFAAVNGCVTGESLGQFVDDDGVEHSLRAVTDGRMIGQLTALMAGRTILIADGHHRYETALRYAQETGDPSAAFVMMTLVSMADPGLVIRSFHRLMRRLAQPEPAAIRGLLSRYFTMTDLGVASLDVVDQALGARDDAEMFFLDSSDRRCYAARLSAGGENALREINNGMSPRWNRLDVSLVNSIFVNKILGKIPDGDVLHDLIRYEKDLAAAFAAVSASNDYYGAFFLRPLSIGTIQEIVAGGERMPQKSTNFFPKCYSGLVLNRLAAS